MKVKIIKLLLLLLLFLTAWISVFSTVILIHLYSLSDTNARHLGQRRLFINNLKRSERNLQQPLHVEQYNRGTYFTNKGFEIISINRTNNGFENKDINRTDLGLENIDINGTNHGFGNININRTKLGFEIMNLNRSEKSIEIKNFTSDDDFFKLREKRLTSYDYNFLITSDQVCDKHETTFLVILCLTQHDNIERRAVIRKTWGSIASSQKWPRIYSLFPGIKMVFLFGRNNDNSTKQAIVNSEHKQFRDVVQSDFVDSYYNLTIKVLMGLKWVNTFCPQAKFALKVDDDTFVHVPNLVQDLHTIMVPQGGAFIGNGLAMPQVVRQGKWRLSEEDYPFNRYPEYLSGNSYVISGDVIPSVLYGAERMPYISIEDAFITGIIRTAIGGSILHRTGYTYAAERAPKMCGFHNQVRISATRVGTLLCGYLWRALHYDRANCYTPPKKQFGKLGVGSGTNVEDGGMG